MMHYRLKKMGKLQLRHTFDMLYSVLAYEVPFPWPIFRMNPVSSSSFKVFSTIAMLMSGQVCRMSRLVIFPGVIHGCSSRDP